MVIWPRAIYRLCKMIQKRSKHRTGPKLAFWGLSPLFGSVEPPSRFHLGLCCLLVMTKKVVLAEKNGHDAKPGVVYMNEDFEDFYKRVFCVRLAILGFGVTFPTNFGPVTVGSTGRLLVPPRPPPNDGI